MDKLEFYITARFDIEDGAPVFGDYRAEFFRSEAEAVENCNKYSEAILAHVILEAKTREEFIKQARDNFGPELFKGLLYEPSWIVENDVAAYVEKCCERFGISEEELEKIQEADQE